MQANDAKLKQETTGRGQPRGTNPLPAMGPIPLRKWGRERGLSAATLWRFRRRGWLHTLNIAGRPYVTAAGLADFERRAEAGEFSQQPSGAAKTR
jgi:hypothetical protein